MELRGRSLGPLFHAGRVKKNHEASKARFEEAKVLYEATVTGRSSEVSGALVDRDQARGGRAQSEPGR